jgi:hypothetical protein
VLTNSGWYYLDSDEPDRMLIRPNIIINENTTYIPHGICLLFRFIGLYFVVLIAWWAILIVGKYPKVIHNYVVGTFRWIMRLNIYMKFMTDKYPPFSGK